VAGLRAGRRSTADFHALRHFFATTLITSHADPKEVQRALRHSTLQITLETYGHFWPRRSRKKGAVGDVLRSAADGLNLG
jgi:integrase